MRAQAEARSEATRKVKALEAKLNTERQQRQIDLDIMTKQVGDIMADAAHSATLEARKEFDTSLQLCVQRHKESQRAKAQTIEHLQKKVTEATAALHRLEANVEEILLEQAEVLKNEHRESEADMVSRHASAEAGLRA